MKHIKHLLFLSILCSLVLFTNCGEDSEDPVADTPTNNTDDDNTDDGSTDPVNYTLTLTASEGGTVSPESGSFGENEAVELLATPDSTYVFVNWTGSSTSTVNPLSVTIDADKSYTANFTKKQYPLTILIEGEGAVSEEIVTNGRVEDYDEGTVVQLTATPLEGWKFNGWKELEVDTNPLEVTITEAITLTAEFTKNYALTLTALEGGTVSPESGSYIENDTVELLATPDSTYVFVNWTGSLTSTDNPLSVIMDADKNFTANFTKKQYPLTIIIDGEGAVSEEIVTNGRIEDYDEGTVVQLTATPSEGWKFNGWKELEVDTNPLEVTITEAITLTARFYVPIDSVSLTPSSLQMVVGDTDTLMASIYPTNVSDTINWKSSDESIVTVNQNGIVTAIAKGEAVITVMTAKDSITNTAQITIVLDADKDGVIDDKDTCADTPEGATVDTNGCADSQKDTDGDGVKDDKDTCADTPEGATVDTNGCADSQKDTDGDGVKDDKDTCADTTEGATVDANGCADSQKDTDGDGVSDDLDTCADTTEGVTVDENGCLVNALYLDENGVTIKAVVDAVIGNSYELGSVSYLVVDEDLLRQMIAEGDDVTKVVTSWVNNMGEMFKDAVNFNQDIGSWDVSNVQTFSHMFRNATSFNQDIGSWDLGDTGSISGCCQSLKEIEAMFFGASSFNQDIGSWDVSNVRQFNSVFHGASSFNQDIGSWDVSNMDIMGSTFKDASSFNQDLSSWDVSNVIYCEDFSTNATAWTEPKPTFTNCTE